jgi:MFS family permease
MIAWGSLYYAFPVLLAAMRASHGWSQPEMIGAFSVSILVSGLCAFPAGKFIQRRGGRAAMSAGSFAAALALAWVAWSPTLAVFYAGWALAGAAMSLTLYEAAFSVLAAIYDADYRRAVTTVTLAGGLASTVFWPLTERLTVWLGWQQTLLVYAGLHLLVCLPLHLRGLPAYAPPQSTSATKPKVSILSLYRRPQLALLAASFTANAIVFSVVSVHLLPLLTAKGLSLQQAAWLAATAGPMQVLGRIVEFSFGDRWRVVQTGTVAMALLLPALFGLALADSWLPIAVSVGFYGISNGVMTIVKSLSTVELFGRENYGSVNGAIAAPALITRSLGPLGVSFLSSYFAVLFLLIAVATLSLYLYRMAFLQKLSKKPM